MPAQIKIDPNEFRLMREYIENNCGIHLTEEKTYLFETRLTPLMAESGCQSFIDLYNKAIADSTHRLRDKIIEAITTNETHWFRDEGPFSILDDVILGEFAAQIASEKRSKIKIWCAACATGQEPYSIAMTVQEFARKHKAFNPEQVEIIGTDISSTVLYIAMAGRYDALSISRGLSKALESKYFEPNGKVWIIKDRVKKMVNFKKINLQDSFASLGKQDIIFCRNVLIYFSNDFKKDILGRIAMSLRPNGYLILGASESIYNFTREYDMLQHAQGSYYQVREEKG